MLAELRSAPAVSDGLCSLDFWALEVQYVGAVTIISQIIPRVLSWRAFLTLKQCHMKCFLASFPLELFSKQSNN